MPYQTLKCLTLLHSITLLMANRFHVGVRSGKEYVTQVKEKNKKNRSSSELRQIETHKYPGHFLSLQSVVGAAHVTQKQTNNPPSLTRTLSQWM